jgi:hypothetical protein
VLVFRFAPSTYVRRMARPYTKCPLSPVPSGVEVFERVEAMLQGIEYSRPRYFRPVVIYEKAAAFW